MELLGQTLGITFKQLQEISDANYETLNRCIDVERVKKEKTHIKDDTIVMVQPIMEHDAAFLKSHRPHYRCLISMEGVTGIQDIYPEQLENQWVLKLHENGDVTLGVDVQLVD